MKKIYLALLLVCLSFAGYAQTAASYAFSRSTGTYQSISGSGIASTAISSDDIGAGSIPIGFTFKYFAGASTSVLAVCSNGWMSLANDPTVGSLSPSTSYLTPGRLMVYWGDNYGTGSTSYYQTTGAVGSRVFTYEWTNWNICCGTGYNHNYQIKLFEGTNIIQFLYGSVSSNVCCRAIGICNSSSDLQVLSTETSTSTITTFSSSCYVPNSGTILQWCPPAAPITGNAPFCSGTNLTLSSATTNGTWSSSNSSVATVGSTGIVTGVAAGTATITLTPAVCGNPATVVVTVNPSPGPNSGNAPIDVCSSVTLTNSTGSGTWSTQSSAIATVGPTTGIVTGAGTGTTNITFTMTGGCFALSLVTVNALPAITGANVLCSGFSTTLAHTTSGGTWGTSSSTMATVSSSGVVTGGVTAGSPTITYTVPGGCFVTKTITVNNAPASISGSSTICGGTVPTSTTLTNSSSGGFWSSSNPALATVGSSTGVVTGVATGNPVISYTLPAGCFVTKPMTVNAVANIAGSASICLGYSTTLSDATFGGVWSSTSTGTATINSASGAVSSVAIGSTNISYTVASLGCAAYTPFNVTTTPVTYSVTGGGSYCSGTTGLHVGLNTSTSGVAYYLYNGATVVAGPVFGTATAIDFGVFTGTGTYTVVAAPGTACATNMSGSATISINPLPTAFSVTGGGAYCSGGAGQHIFISSSTIGVNYQLMLGSTPVGSPVAGTSATIDFGLFTAAGVYTVIATNATTGCINNMSGSATISINALPTSFAITGGGNFCLGSAGVHIGLANSAIGTTYQLLLSGAPVGAPLAGTAAALDFGFITTSGLYTIQATNTVTGCINGMSGTATVSVNPLPTVFNVTGGGAYCAGGTGIAVGLNGTSNGVNYQLYVGSTPVGIPVAGTGASITFGLQTIVGSYTVVATNTTTGCVNNMFSSASVSTNPLPTSFIVTGGGNYCVGGAGLPVGLSGSTSGTTYQLFCNGILVGGGSGGGGAISFGVQTLAGVYTVVGTTTATGCVGNMSGSVNIVINPLPTVFTVTGGGNYCAGGVGLADSLNGSTSGVNYQLYNAGVPVGSVVAGTGLPISFGLQTAAGAYTVVGVNATTGCIRNMSGSASIVINPLPVIYAVTGGGGYCVGGTGVHIGIANSNTGIGYQLMNGSPVGSIVAGTGAAIDLGLFTTAGTYTIVATNPSTACTNNMSGTAVVVVNSLPTPYTVTGGGNYCAGGTGVPVGLFTSATGVNYQLYRGATAVGSSVAGTGSSITFGAQTVAGNYTVVATHATAGCINNMLGTVTVAINPLPAVFPITGGGNYCAGGTGVHVGLGGSASGINYQLMNGVATVGVPIPGTGGALDFGLKTGTGAYTVVATNPGTGCINNMTGSVTIGTIPQPAAYTISGGGNYCAGGTGLHVGLLSSATGVSYQLYNGTTPMGAPMGGTGTSLDFGLQTISGTYTVVATNTSTGCSRTMTGTTSVIISPYPALHSVTGGGNYCLGGAGVNVGLDNSNTGTSYQLYYGAAPIGAAVPGSTGLPISFGLQTTLGMYTVVATTTSSTCSTNMTGSVSVGTYPLPTVYVVTGGGNFCLGSTGVHVGLSNSSTGVMYQLMNGGSFAGAPLTGTGGSLDFGLQATAGTYTVVATTIANGCSNTMGGSAILNTYALPALHNVTGGGNYCSGTTGVHIGLDGSNVGTNYQLMNGMTPVGALVAGTGVALDFGLQTGSGTYTVTAIATATTCTNTMSGNAIINIDPLPTVYAVVGGGNYCSGGTGVNVGLASSDGGTTYQLMRGTVMVGTPLAGTGSALDFGMQTTGGTYTVKATNTITGCMTTMGGSVNVVVDPLPVAFTVGGGGNYCAGGSGVHVTLSGSASGVTYQLMNGMTPSGTPMLGTGSSLDFGLRTAAGTYTVAATNNVTSCNTNMTGSVAIVINPLPIQYGLSSTSSTYCAGGAGVDMWLVGSEAGVNYQLYNGVTATGSPLAGTGSSVDFGNQLAAGNYSVIGVNATTGCTKNMTGGVSVAVNAVPVAYNVTGGGSYCIGGSGVNVGLSGSTPGISYQLMIGGVPSGSTMTGTGGSLNFGLRTAAGAYTIVATNMATTCTNTMNGTVSVAINPIPTAFTVGGGGNYCNGGTGVHVTLSGSTLGVNYQLYRNGLTVVGLPVAGTGATLDFGFQTMAGTYTVVAMNAVATTCSNNMTGSVAVGINPLPTVFTVIGGGSYCPGGSGVHVGMSGTSTGASYQLYKDGIAVGMPVAGSGSSIDFGLQTATGVYTVFASDNITSCTNLMSGSATVAMSPLPTAFNVVGGGNYCAGGSGVHVGLSSSVVGVNYTLYRSFTTVVTLPGTGGPLDFGLMTTAGTYTVSGVNASTGCQASMLGSVSVGINPVVTPFVTISTGVGDTVCEGSLITFTATPANGGTAPSFQWSVNGVASSTGTSYSYVPANSDVVSVTLTSSAACAVPSTVYTSKTMTVDPHLVPSVAVSANPGNVVCQGTSVTFTAAPVNGGTAPTYIWMKNGFSAGSSPTFSYVPMDGDVVYCTMASSYHCRTSNTASSNHVNMDVAVPVLPVVSIAVYPGNSIAAGQDATFTATVLNGGPTPSFQWLVNGIAVPGATNPIFVTSNLSNDDSVTCQVLSSGGCPGLLGFNAVRVHIYGVGVQQVAAANADIKLLPNPNKGNFTVKGTLGITTDEQVTVEVTNMLGQVIYTTQVTAHNGELNERIELGNNLTNGMYILNLRTGADNKVFHVVIEQ